MKGIRSDSVRNTSAGSAAFDLQRAGEGRYRQLARALASGGPSSILCRILAGVIAAALGVAWRLGISGELGERIPYVTFYPAVLIAGLAGGTISGAVALVLCVLAAHLWIAPLSDRGDVLALLSFVAGNVVIVGVTEALHRALTRANEAEASRAAQAALAQNARLAEQFGSVAASAPGVIFSLRLEPDGKGSYPFASANLRNVCGVAPEEIRTDSRPIFHRVHPDDIGHVNESIAESARRMELLNEEFRYHHPAKGLIWLEAQGTPIRESDGSVVWHGYAQDVTERKRVEQKLRTSEARTRAFFDSGLLGVVYWNMDGAITDANDKFLDMLGYTREELLAGKIDWMQITPPQFRVLGEAAPAELRATGVNGRPFEKEYLRKNGTRLPVLVAGAMAGEERVKGVAFVLDISEHKRAEKHMQKLQADRLDAAWRLATGLAHELNQPISAAATYLKATRRLLKMKPERRPADIEETLDYAATQMMRAGEIINNIRGFVSGGDPEMSFARLHDLIIEAWESTAPAANYLRVKLALDAQDDRVLADRVQIKQVLSNLIRNALEAMSESKRRELTISTSSIGKDAVRVDIADSGMGLSEHMGTDLFTAGTSTKENGMGFGLSICRSLIEAHHGKIWAEPNPEGGAVFSFTLPLVDEPGDAASQRPLGSEAAGRMSAFRSSISRGTKLIEAEPQE